MPIRQRIAAPPRPKQRLPLTSERRRCVACPKGVNRRYGFDSRRIGRCGSLWAAYAHHSPVLKSGFGGRRREQRRNSWPEGAQQSGLAPLQASDLTGKLAKQATLSIGSNCHAREMPIADNAFLAPFSRSELPDKYGSSAHRRILSPQRTGRLLQNRTQLLSLQARVL